jgi:UDP-3-O-[3-hydroxymyristoyl] glucosamine N-acyltransferase
MDRKSFTLDQLAEITQSTLVGNPQHRISGVDALDSARPEDATFLANARYRPLLKTTQAGVICIDLSIPIEEGKNFLISDNPSLAFQNIINLLHAETVSSGFKGIHPTALIHPTAKIGKDVEIGPYVVIDQGVEIGDRSRLYAFVSVGSHVKIGTECLIYPHVTIRECCILGSRVILQPGAVIGSCGFGYATNAQGQHIKLEQVGCVILEDDVEIGANTSIDRARFKTTRIGQGTKIDNLVQIGHNVTLGENNIIVSQTGIAGSVKTGKYVIMGGQAGVVGHVEIADHVMIATRGGISKSLTQPGKYAGEPVMNLADHNRQQVHLRKIANYVKQLEKHEKRLNELEKKLYQS